MHISIYFIAAIFTVPLFANVWMPYVLSWTQLDESILWWTTKLMLGAEIAFYTNANFFAMAIFLFGVWKNVNKKILQTNAFGFGRARKNLHFPNVGGNGLQNVWVSRNAHTNERERERWIVKTQSCHSFHEALLFGWCVCIAIDWHMFHLSISRFLSRSLCLRTAFPHTSILECKQSESAKQKNGFCMKTNTPQAQW